MYIYIYIHLNRYYEYTVKYSSIIYTTRQLLQNFPSFGPRHKQWGKVSPTQSWKRCFSSSKKGSFLFCCVPLMVESPGRNWKKNSTHFFWPTLVGWDFFFGGGSKKNHPRNTAKTRKNKKMTEHQMVVRQIGAEFKQWSEGKGRVQRSFFF